MTKESKENIFQSDSSKFNNNETKIGKVTNLVLKINNSGKLYKICAERFGKDFLDKLLNPDTSEFIINPLEDYIFDQENLHNKIEQMNNKLNHSVNKSGLYENYPNDMNDENNDNTQYVPNLNTDVR